VRDEYGSGEGPVAGSGESINEYSGSIKCSECLDCLRNYQL